MCRWGFRLRAEAWARGYFDLALQSGVLRAEHEDTFMTWFDLMGVQRHLKASGIFARLNIRDGKAGYLKDIPRTLDYILEISHDHPVLAGLDGLLREKILPEISSGRLISGQ